MADVKEVAIRLKALNADFKRGMSDSGDATRAFGTVSTVALAAAGVAAVGFAKSAADAYVNYGKEIIKLSRVSGENVETSSRMQFAAQQSGVSANSLANGVKFLEKSMAAANPAFATLGVNVRDTNGRLRSSHDVLLDTADALSKMQNGAAKTDAIIKIFGRSGLEMGPLLSKGRDAIVALEKEAEKYGLVLTKDNISAIQQNIAAHRQLDAAMLGLKVRVGEEVLPAFTKITEVLARLPGPVMSIAPPLVAGTAALGLMASTGMKLWDVGSKLADKIPNLGASAAGAGVAIGGALAVYAIWNNRMQEAYKNAESLGKIIDKANTSDTYSGMADRIGRINDQIGSLDEEVRNSSAPWDADYRAEMEAYKTQLEKSRDGMQANVGYIDDLSAATGKSKDEMKRWLDAEAAAGRTYSSSGAALQAYTGNIDRNKMSTEEATTAVDAYKQKTKEANDAQKASLDPQFAYIDATNKLRDAKAAQTAAERGVADAQRQVVDGQEAVTRAERTRTEATKRVTEAVADQRVAQQALADLLRGPSEDEQLNIESAQISLAEARRRATGQTGTDPALEKRRAQLELRRAESAVREAEAAHGKNVDAARKNLASADKAVADAQQAQQDATKGVDEANRALAGYVDNVAAAQQKAQDATTAIARANLDLDVAARNLETAFATGDVSMAMNAETLDRWVQQGRLTRDMADQLIGKFNEMKDAAKAANPDPPAATPAQPAAPVANAGGAYITSRAMVDYSTDDAVLKEFYRRNPGHKQVGIAWARDWLKKNLAAGGALAEGWNLVGEHGPELLYKVGAAAHVSSAPATSSMLAAHPFMHLPTAPAGGAGTGGFTHNGDIVIGQATRQTAFEIAWQQRKLSNTAGRS